MTSSLTKRHLFVFAHGLVGDYTDLSQVKRYLKGAIREYGTESHELYYLMSKSNRRARTYDGLQILGERLYKEVTEKVNDLKVKSGIEIDDISFIGHSLGGLITRYCIGICEREGLFEKYRPMIYCSFATPHVSTGYYGPHLSGKFMCFLGSKTFGKTSADCFDDKSELIYEMASPSSVYFKGLSRFQNRLLLANTQDDHAVPFYTSYITPSDFAHHAVSFSVLEVNSDKEFTNSNSASCSSSSVASISSAETSTSTLVAPIVDLASSKLLDSNNSPHDYTKFRKTMAFYLLLPLLLFGNIFLQVASTLRIMRYKNLSSGKSTAELQEVKSASHQNYLPNRLLTKAISNSNLVGRYSNHDHNINRKSKSKSKSDIDNVINTIDYKISNNTCYEIFEKVEIKNLPTNVRTMIDNLNTLTWEKYAIDLKGKDAHVDIICMRGPDLMPEGAATLQFWGKRVVKLLIGQV